MNKLSLLFESPPWLIGVGILLGIAYAAVLYYRIKAPWNRNINYILAALRLMLVAQLSLLLFGPLIRQIKNTRERPAIVLAVDNSGSISEIEDSLSIRSLVSGISNLETALNDAGYLVEIRTLNGTSTPESLTFNANSSDLNQMLRGIQNDYESRNLAHVLLFSDGLFNIGSNPSFYPYNFRIHTIGLGDTTHRPDLNLNALLYNKIAYQGNQFPVVAELFSYNLAGQEVTVKVEENDLEIDRTKIRVRGESQFDQIKFLIEAKEGGMHRYRVSAVPVENEFITSNNTKEAYVEIIEGRQKILVVAAAPHPDIKAIKSALESNQNYEVVIHIDGIQPYVEDKYDAIVLHQVPDRRRRYQEILQKIQQEQIPAFFIFGNQSDINAFNDINGAVRIMPISFQKDQVFPVFNTNFGRFLFSQENAALLNEYTPVTVPFANYAVLTQAEIMLYQKVGRVNTQKPLLVMQKSNGWSSAVMLGEGLWNWRVQEFARTQQREVFDEMLTKIVQYLSAKEDKRRFKVYPVKNEFLNSETIVFETEVYNEIYEPTYGHKIDLQLTNDQNRTSSYTYITSEQNSSYRISGLDDGIYKFTASAIIDGVRETVNGAFSVRDLQIETTNLTADHQLMQTIASRNSGDFFLKNQIENLKADLLAEEQKYKIYSSESYLAIINLKWAFFILILFVSIEWFLRKFHGSY